MFDFSQNYFSLFNLTPGFELDPAVLTQCYRDVQAQVHPDRFAGKSEQEQRLAVQITAFVNEAYQCLKNPLLRAQYLLKLAGLEIKADSKTHNDADFLFQQIELRERLEIASQQQDVLAALDVFIEEVQANELLWQQQFVDAYQQQKYELAVDKVLKWHFLVKLHADAQKMQDQLDD